MAETVIYATDSLEFGPQSNYGGIYGQGLTPAKFALELNKRYIVAWDGNTYTCQAQDGSAMSTGAVAIGGLNIFGGASNGEPFAIVYVPAEDINLLFAVDGSTAISHAVTIYQIVEEETKIIVKDRDGNDVTHEGASAIRVRTADGNTKDFVDSDTMPESVETSVELDFSTGDMEVQPGEDELFSKVIIGKPETLIPENIAEGVDIAGVIGKLAGGGKEIGTFGYLKYIIPISQTIVKSSFSLTTSSLTFKRTTTERIHVILFPPQNSTPESRYWIHSVCYGCNYFSTGNATIVYSHSASSMYSGTNTSASGIQSTKFHTGNLTEVTETVLFNSSVSNYNHYPTGTYHGFILVTDTARSGPATLLRENNYIISTGIKVINL